MSKAIGIQGLSLGAIIGSGGFATVFAGQRSGREVAVKIAHGTLAITRARFEREVDALARVGRPWVPELIDSGVLADGRPYLVMERISAPTLGELLHHSGAQGDAPAVERILDGLLECFAVLEQKDIVHRDIKPSNIFVDEDRVMLTDFGLARGGFDSALTRSSVRPGTRAYMSPEQLRGEPATLRGDFFSLGVVLFELVHGMLPFDADEHGRTDQLLHRPRRPSRPSRYDKLIGALLAKSPEQRPASVDAIRVALEELPEVGGVAHVAAAVAPSEASTLPAVVLATELTTVTTSKLDNLVSSHRGFIAKLHGSVALAVFDVERFALPLGDAVSAANALVAAGQRCQLHLAPLRIRRRVGRPPKARGEALDDISWLELPDRPSIAVSDALAASAPSLRGDLRGDAVPLVGREPVLEILRTSSRAGAAGEPHLVTIFGASGLGKSRLAREAAVVAKEAGLEVISLAGRSLPATLDPTVVPDGTAVVVDDGDQLSPEGLAALERLVSAAEGRRLWVVMTADPRLKQSHPSWAERVDHPISIELSPLELAASRELTAAHLYPVEYPPHSVLDRIHTWAGGSPRLIGLFVELLRQHGAIRQRGEGMAQKLATEVLDEIPSSVEQVWGVRHALDSLPGGFSALIELCSIYPRGFTAAEVLDCLGHLEAQGAEVTRLDPSTALKELVVYGWLVADSNGVYRFVNSASREAVQSQMETPKRRRFHLAALEQARATDDHERISVHAGECGQRELAAESALAVADRERSRFQHVAAERWANRALELLDGESTPLRCQAFIARGRARYHFLRTDEAKEDLQAATAIAREIKNDELLLDATLELAAAHDWSWEFAAAAELTEEALTIIGHEHGERLRLRLDIARGRDLWRAADAKAAVPILTDAVETAGRLGDIESETVARLMLSAALLVAGDLKAAEVAFTEAIAFCKRVGDLVHVGAGYNNRSLLWQALSSPERGVEDMRRAAEIGQTTGQGVLEASANYNLAELLLWAGDNDGALAAGLRSYALQTRLIDPTPAIAPLLLARIHRLAGNPGLALPYLEEAADCESISPADAVMLEALSADGDDPEWPNRLERASAHLPLEGAIEIHYLAVLAARDADLSKLADRRLEDARPLVEKRALWKKRWLSLSSDRTRVES